MASHDGLPPGPRYPKAMQGMAFWSRPLASLEKWRARYGNRFTVALPGPSPTFVMLADPEQVKEVFRAPPDVLHPGSGARILEPIVGSNSVLLLDEDAHMEQRKLMLPAFHGERMARLTDLMKEVTAREVERWPRGERIQLHPRMQALTLEVILRAVFGLKPGPRLDGLREALAEMLEFGDRPVSLLPPPPGSRLQSVLQRIPPFVTFVRAQARSDELIYGLIEERRNAADGGDDVLAMLLDARHEDGSPMSDQELRDELLTLLVAGHETTASALAWAFSRLPHYPEVLARLNDEVASGDDDEYTTATIHEILRRRPVLPNVGPRLVMKEVEIGGWRYPTGVALVPNAYLIHHDPQIYPEPYAFRPERFLEQSPGTYTWIPFGGGRRRCLGASFAMLEMKIVLRAVLASGEVRASGDGIEVARRRNITIRPARGAQAVLA